MKLTTKKSTTPHARNAVDNIMPWVGLHISAKNQSNKKLSHSLENMACQNFRQVKSMQNDLTKFCMR
jgi:hypothetical protein